MNNRTSYVTLVALISAFFALGLIPAQAMAGWFACEPNEVMELGNRIHVRCSNTVTLDGDTVRYIAIGKSDDARSARFVSMGNAALLSGKTFIVHIPWSSDSNTAGCATSNCRSPTAFGVKN
jgi:hypothetical protein